MALNSEHLTLKTDKIPCQEISDPSVLSRNPLVSVHMITYNHEPYIVQAIEGVLFQETNFPIELVIGEDCSGDGTREIVLEYQKKYPEICRVITSEKNVGMHKNCLRIEKACRGKYIAYCEGDDYWHHPLKLQKQVDYMESHPDVGLVHSGADTYHVESNRRLRWLPKPINIIEDDKMFITILESNYQIKTLTVLVRRVLLANLINSYPDFFSEKYLFGDHQRWLLVSRVSKVRFINESLATRTVLTESATHSRDIKNVIRMLESVYELKMKFWTKFNCPQELATVIRQKHYEAVLGVAFNAMNREVAYAAYREMKRQGVRPTMKQHLFFVGASNKMVNTIIRLLMRSRSKVVEITYR